MPNNNNELTKLLEQSVSINNAEQLDSENDFNVLLTNTVHENAPLSKEYIKTIQERGLFFILSKDIQACLIKNSDDYKKLEESFRNDLDKEDDALRSAGVRRFVGEFCNTLPIIQEYFLNEACWESKEDDINHVPLALLIEDDRKDVITALLNDAKLNPNLNFNAGYALLHWACYFQRHELVRLLLDHNADPNSGWKGLFDFGDTDVNESNVENINAIIDTLLDKRANINFKVSSGHSPLHLLCRQVAGGYGNTGCFVRLFAHLFSHHADIYQLNDAQRTPLTEMLYYFSELEEFFQTEKQVIDNMNAAVGRFLNRGYIITSNQLQKIDKIRQLNILPASTITLLKNARVILKAEDILKLTDKINVMEENYAKLKKTAQKAISGQELKSDIISNNNNNNSDNNTQRKRKRSNSTLFSASATSSRGGDSDQDNDSEKKGCLVDKLFKSE